MGFLIRIAALASALAFWPAGVSAADLETALMTWPEIRDAVAAGKTTIIIPVGGTEQNGPHMITGRHNIVVAGTARGIAARLGDALVAPVIAYVPEGDPEKQEGHTAYPGTISVPADVFARTIESAAVSFKVHGFKTIVFLGDHGSYQNGERSVAADLSKRWASEGVRVIAATKYYEANGQTEFLKSEGETDATIGQHAGIRDTSELLAVFPAGVRDDKRTVDADGMTGDARRATPERGQKMLDLKVETAVNEIKGARAAPIEPAAVAPPGVLTRLWHLIFG